MLKLAIFYIFSLLKFISFLKKHLFLSQKPKILISNDDGVHAAGLWHLYRALTALGEVTVVAPEREMSGTSHAFTFSGPLRLNQVIIEGNHAYSVNGTPADAVKIGVTQLYTSKPDFIVSGINAGDNTGVSCFYSGTVAAAREGCFWRIPSLAVSVSRREPESFDFAAARTVQLLERIYRRDICFDASRVFLNINFPNCVPADIKGLRVARQGTAPFIDGYKKCSNSAGQIDYCIFGEKDKPVHADDDDVHIKQGMATVTPLMLDNTDHDFYHKYKETELISW